MASHLAPDKLKIYSSKCIYLMCLCVCHVLVSAYRSYKGESDPLELEIQEIVSHPPNARNWTQVLWKSRKHSQLQSLLSNPQYVIPLLYTHMDPKLNSEAWCAFASPHSELTLFILYVSDFPVIPQAFQPPLIPWTPLLLRFPREFTLFCVVVSVYGYVFLGCHL